jgi:Zn-dependent protease with chaperone function
MGTAVVLALLFGVAITRTVAAGCPDSNGYFDLACLFLPTHTDFGIHLLGYILIGMSLLGISFGLKLYLQQLRNTHAVLDRLPVIYPEIGWSKLPTDRLNLTGKVYLLDSVASLCFCGGLVSPSIYISRGMVEKLQPEELEALLLHEKHHLENHDPLKTLLGKALSSAFFFIPVLRDILNRWRIEKEIAADENAIRHQGHRRGIASALTKLLDDHGMVTLDGVASNSTESLQYRIDHLTGSVHKRAQFLSRHRLVTSLLVLTVILAILLAPLQASHPVTL